MIEPKGVRQGVLFQWRCLTWRWQSCHELRAKEQETSSEWEPHIVSQEQLRASPEGNHAHPDQDKPADRAYIPPVAAQLLLRSVPDDFSIVFDLQQPVHLFVPLVSRERLCCSWSYLQYTILLARLHCPLLQEHTASCATSFSPWRSRHGWKGRARSAEETMCEQSGTAILVIRQKE
jgi:hypothetical protein